MRIFYGDEETVPFDSLEIGDVFNLDGNPYLVIVPFMDEQGNKVNALHFGENRVVSFLDNEQVVPTYADLIIR